jgi:hypothetical protein
MGRTLNSFFFGGAGVGGAACSPAAAAAAGGVASPPAAAAATTKPRLLLIALLPPGKATALQAAGHGAEWGMEADPCRGLVAIQLPCADRAPLLAARAVRGLRAGPAAEADTPA